MKILIVDDSRLVRIKLKAELFDRGHTVIEARDGEEALRHIADKSPDAVPKRAIHTSGRTLGRR